MTAAKCRAPGNTFSIRRDNITTTQLVMYAGASGDFNRIHYDHQFAVAKGLGGVIAHGMLTMAFAASCAVEAFGAENWVSHIDARFTSPVRVGDTVEITATVSRHDASDGAIEAMLVAQVDGRTVLRGSVGLVPAARSISPDAGQPS